jgi:hypothetical protein
MEEKKKRGDTQAEKWTERMKDIGRRLGVDCL